MMHITLAELDRLYPVPTSTQIMAAFTASIPQRGKHEFRFCQLALDVTRRLFPERSPCIPTDLWEKSQAAKAITSTLLNYLKKSPKCHNNQLKGYRMRWIYDESIPENDHLTKPYNISMRFYNHADLQTNMGLVFKSPNKQQTNITAAITPWLLSWLETMTTNKSLFMRTFVDSWLTYWEKLTADLPSKELALGQSRKPTTYRLYSDQIKRVKALAKKGIFANPSECLYSMLLTMYQDEHQKSI